MTPARGVSVCGYVRVSTSEQASSGLGMAAQRPAIEAECERRGWTLVQIFEDNGGSAKSTKNRHWVAGGGRVCQTGRAGRLVTAKIDRLARSLLDFCELLDRADRGKWSLVAL